MTPQEIANAAKCLECQIPVGMQIPALIYIWSQAVGITDINVILAGAVQMNKIPPNLQGGAMIYLLDKGVNG